MENSKTDSWVELSYVPSFETDEEIEENNDRQTNQRDETKQKEHPPVKGTSSKATVEQTNKRCYWMDENQESMQMQIIQL